MTFPFTNISVTLFISMFSKISSKSSNYSIFLKRNFTEIPKYILQTPKIEITTLSNGIRVISQFVPTSSFTAGIWIDSGSRYETPETNGSAHFLEHLLFKGTKSRTMTQLQKTVEDFGCRLNAYTAREMTAYFIQSLNSNVSFALDILSNMFLDSLLSNSRINEEKSTIIRESQDIASTKSEAVMDLLHEAAYGKEGLGLTILGTDDNIMNMTRQHLVDYITTHYTGNRIVLSACGGVKHDDFVKEVEHYFKRVPSPQTNNIPPISYTYTGGYKQLCENHHDGYVAYGYEIGGWNDPSSLDLFVILKLIGEWNRNCGSKNAPSELISLLSEKGIGRSISPFYTCYKDTGLFGVQGVCDNKELPEMSRLILESFTKMKDTFGDEEFERAKELIYTNRLLELDDTVSRCEDMARQLLAYGRIVPTAEMYVRLQELTKNDVIDTMNKCFNTNKKLSIGAVGDVDSLPSLEELESYRIPF